MLRWLLLLGLVGCATTQSAPVATFDSYKSAFANGNAAKMWSLTAPGARQKVVAFRSQLLELLNHKDPVRRLSIEGNLAVTAIELAKMNIPTFFAWTINTIRKRLGPGTVRKRVESMVPVRVQAIPGGAAVIYRQSNGMELPMPMVRMGGRWLVNEVPLPKAID